MKPSEYQEGLRAENWKLDLIQAINEALEYAIDWESFIRKYGKGGLWSDLDGYPEAWSQTKGGWEKWQAALQEGLEETDDGTEADRRYTQLEHKCVERNFTMASIKKVDTRKFKITVSNG